MVKNSVALAQFQSAFMQSKTGVKTVAITGYSGMIGTKLKKELESSGVTVNRIVTNYPKNDYSPIDMSALEGADAALAPFPRQGKRFPRRFLRFRHRSRALPCPIHSSE